MPLYLPHPIPYNIAALEKFYARMAEKGWLLEHHGTVFSRFRRSEPQELCFRAQLFPEGAISLNGELQRDLLEEYTRQGWMPKGGSGSLFLFQGPRGQYNPQMPLREDVRSVCRAENERFAKFSAVAYPLPVFLFVCIALRAGSSGLSGAALLLLEQTWLVAFLLLLILFSFRLVRRIAGGWAALADRLDAGLPLNSPAKHSAPARVADLLLLLLTAVCLFFTLSQHQQNKPQPLPQHSQPPYFSVQDLEYDDPVETRFSSSYNFLRHFNAPLAEVWHSNQAISAQWDAVGEEGYWQFYLGQDTYTLPSEALAGQVAELLMSEKGKRTVSLRPGELIDKVYYQYHRSDFSEAEHGGFDALWWNETEQTAVAVKGCTVWRFHFTQVRGEVDFLALLAQFQP